MLVQMPVQFVYTALFRRNPTLYFHLAKRVVYLSLFTYPWSMYSFSKLVGLSDRYSEKYLYDLTEFELKNFHSIY